MYKSRDNEYQRRFDDNEPQSSYGYENKRPPYQDDVYDEDDFYGQIMRNASRNKPYQNPSRQEYDTYERGYAEPPRRSRAEATGRMPRIEEDAYSRGNYDANRAPYPTSSEPYAESYKEPEYTQPIRAYERTSQFAAGQLNPQADEYAKTSNYREPKRETPSRRSRMQEEAYPMRETQPERLQVEQTSSLRRRSRPTEPLPVSSYGGFTDKQDMERKGPMTLSEEYESQQKSKRSKMKPEKRKTQKEDAVSSKYTNSYKQFVKSNLIILLIAFINMTAISLILTSLLYTQFLKNYIVQPTLTNDMIKMCLLLAPVFAYQVAGLHCGYTMMKDKIKGMKTLFKVLLFPILFIVFECIGFICEIPYLIYCAVKMQDEEESLL